MAAESKPHSVIVPVDRMEASVGFFRDVMGLKLKFQDGERYAGFEFGNLTLALTSGSENITDGPALVFRVGDIEATVGEIQRAGGEVVRAIEQGPHEKRAVVRQTGNALVVLSQKTA